MIYITGDTHGTIDIEKLKYDTFISKDDYLIIAGDVAVCWDGGRLDKETKEYWASKPYTVLFVDGNHEGFTELYNQPEEIWNGGRVHRILPNMLHLERGQVFTIEGKTFFTFGGGLSIDKIYRTPYVSWWPEEEPTVKQTEEAMNNLDKYGWKVDYVITHAAPEYVVRNVFTAVKPLLKEDCSCEKFLDTIYNKLDFQTWFCGHYHFDTYLKTSKIMELYQDVVKLSKGYPICNTTYRYTT